MTALGWAVAGFGATVVLTTLLAVSQGLGWTRMSLPYLLGAMFTPDRDRARALGILVHLANGWMFSLIYLAAFSATGLVGILPGSLIGLVHGLFVSSVGLPALAAFHPRMARPHAGPTSVRRLEPPGFFARNYGWSTSAWIVVAHVLFGALLGLAARLVR